MAYSTCDHRNIITTITTILLIVSLTCNTAAEIHDPVSQASKPDLSSTSEWNNAVTDENDRKLLLNKNQRSILNSNIIQKNSSSKEMEMNENMETIPVIKDEDIIPMPPSNKREIQLTTSVDEEIVTKRKIKEEHVEKIRLHRKKIQDERRTKIKEFRSRHSKPHNPPPKSNKPRTRKNLKPNVASLDRMDRDEVEKVIQNNRELWNFNLRSGVSVNPYDISSTLADPGAEYDEWQQAYRTLGAFVDCDHSWRASGSGDKNNNDGVQCNRWMMWAAYIDPNYQGGGWDEYHPDFDDDNDEREDDTYYGSLDCHLDNTEWQLLGVYRQEFYQYLEQISKHLWGADEWEYIVALATLEYIGDDECEAVGYDNNAEVLYASIQPLEMGQFQMGLYSDENCLYPLDLDELGYTYDDFWDGGDRRKLEEGDQNDDYYWWNSAQEYTLTSANEVYDTFKYCTLCIDYPTYQDGELNGDSGYDDDDLINQCWKFYSHDSYNCGAECIRTGHAQGSIANLKYGENYFGTRFTDDEYTSTSSSTHKKATSTEESSGNFIFSPEKMDRLKANVFVTFSGILFVATFLAFSVARSSREVSREDIRKMNDRRRKNRVEASDADRQNRRRRRSRTGRQPSESNYEPPNPRGDDRERRRRSKKKDGRRSRSRGGRPNRSASRGREKGQNYRDDDF